MQIYIAEGTQRTGPFDLDAIKAGLRTGKYTPAQLAWYEGAPGWGPISELPGLQIFLSPPPAPIPLPPGERPLFHADAFPPDAFPPPARPRRSRWWKVAGFALGIVALVDGITTLTKGFHPTFSPDASSATPSGTTRHFVTDRSKYSGNVAEHYVKFSFDYPEAWTVKENPSEGYIELRHMTRLSNGKDVPVESITFTYACSNVDYQLSRDLDQVGPAILEQTAAVLTKRAPDCTVTPAKRGQYGKYPAEERLGTIRNSNDHLDDYFRMIVVPQQNDSTNGLYINLWGNTASGAKSAETLGDSGGLRTIRDSFRFEP